METLQFCMEITILLRSNDAADAVCWEFRLCSSNNIRWIFSNQEDDRGRSDPVILTVCKKLQPADHTVSTVGNMMQTTAASAERVFEFLEEEEEIEVEKTRYLLIHLLEM